MSEAAPGLPDSPAYATEQRAILAAAIRELIDVTMSPADQGFLKPHPAIFRAATDRMGIRPDEAAMVGDSLAQDVIGARQAGMRGILLARGGPREPVDADIEVIQSLHELPARMHDDCAA